MKTIGIIGQGFVGTAVYEGMKHAFDIATYDKKQGITHNKWIHDLQVASVFNLEYEGKELEYILKVDGPIFVCLPTPMRPDGSCDLSIVTYVIEELNRLAAGGDKRVVVIKSTVVPGTTEKLNAQCENLHVCFNPEFLTERNAIEDFKHQDRIIVGGPREGTNVLKGMYATAYPDVPVTKTSSIVAELVKYTTNCFLATKVAFSNEMAMVCDALNVDYDKVIEYATKDERLGQSHWAVPGPDGKKGFGGSCFVKDLNALLNLTRELKIDADVLEGTWTSNIKVRPERDWEQLVGRAVSETS